MKKSPQNQSRFLDIVFVIFAVMQVSDGLLTYFGINYGISSEGNPIVGYFIASFGLFPGLLIAKTIGLICGASLYYHGNIKALALLTLIMAIPTILWINIIHATK